MNEKPGPGSGPRTPSIFITTPKTGCSDENRTARFFGTPASRLAAGGGFTTPSATVGRSEGVGAVDTGFADGCSPLARGPFATIADPDVIVPGIVRSVGPPFKARATKKAPV